MADVLREDDDEKDNENIVIVEQDQGDQDQDQEDERVATQEDDRDPEREAIRERRRLEKQDRKERRDKAINRDKVELDFLRKRNDDLERRISTQEQRANSQDLNNLDAQINQAAQEADMAERVIAKAVESGNGSDVTQALRYRDASLAKIQQLQLVKQQANARPAPPAVQLDDAAMHYAKEFIADNPWYDAHGRDEESAIVLAIDSALVKDGFDPRSEEYWDELRHRSARRLPERFSEGGSVKKVGRQPRGGPTVGSGREYAPTSTRTEIHISPERKAALVEAGVWDDPVLRMKYAKRYAEYDRNNRSK